MIAIETKKAAQYLSAGVITETQLTFHVVAHGE
jgi:hypothetical protein